MDIDKKPPENGQDQTDAQNSASESIKPSNSKILLTIIGILSAAIIALVGYVIMSSRRPIEGPKEPIIRTVVKTVNKTPVRVKSFSPSGHVPQKTNFTMTFSQNVVDDSSVNILLDSVPVEITPRIPGKYKWLARHKLGFFPDVELYPSTEYNVEILPEICPRSKETGLVDLYLIDDTQFKFFSSRFRVKDSLVSFEFDPNEHSRVKIKAAVEFNYPVRVVALAENMSIAYEGKQSIPYQISTKEKSAKIIELVTEEVTRGRYDAKIKLTINKGLKCVDGTLGLADDYISYIALKSEKPLQVEWISPEQRAGQGYVSIRLTSPVDSSTAKEFVTVTPETDYHIVSNYRYLELRGNFKPGESYTVVVKKGLRAQDESVLKRVYSTQVAMRDLKPSIGFIGDGIYLSKDGNLNIGLSTINVNKVQIELDKVFANNLVYLIASGKMRYHRSNVNNLGKNIFRDELDIVSERNKEVITPIDLKKYLASERIGVFRVSAFQENRRWRKTVKWVMITDLGIMVKRTEDELLVWVNSLSSLKPIKNAEITLFSKNNQILLSGRTNQDGVVEFRSIKDKLEGFEPFLITASFGNDLSFVELNNRRISTTDFDVGGKPVISGGYDAFVYTDRGVYRPGENVNCVVIVRQDKRDAHPTSEMLGLPIKMQVIAPDDRIFKEFRGQLNREGACEFKVDLPKYIKTGGYIAKILVAKEAIGRATFSVEEFMPDRIKVKVETDKAIAATGGEVKVDVQGEYLFGGPVAGGRVDADCTVEAQTFSKTQWSSFTFSDTERGYQRQDIQLGEAQLNDEGQYSYTLKIPTDLSPPSSLRGVIAATVHEPGGRAVSAYKVIAIHPYSHYVGIRRAEDGYAKIGEDAKFEYIVAAHDGKVVHGRELKVSCYHLRWHSILKWRDGRYHYTSERQKELLKSFVVTSQDGVGFFEFKPTDYGRYKIEIEDGGDLLGHIASTTFYASGWGYAPWAMENPDRLEIGLDRDSYLPGDVAKVQIRAPFSGKLILTIEREKIYDYRMVMMEENTAELELDVKDLYAPNVYVSVSVLRSTKSLERHAPARAFGVVPLKINTDKNRLAIKLDTVSEIRPNKELTIDFTIATIGSSQSKGYVTIAAVDEGICQLTDFKTPNPYEYFFAKRRLGLSSYDIYSAILPEVEPASSSSTTGGGRIQEDIRKKHLSPISVQRVKPVSLWSGLVETDENGKGSMVFEIPQFNGSVRIMAVAFSGDKFGAVAQNVTVREPIMLMPSYPRFISSGDTFKIPVTIFNHTGKDAEFDVKLETVGPVEILENEEDAIRDTKHKTQISIPNEKSGQVFWEASAHEWIGKVTFNLSAEGGGESTSHTTDVPVRPSVPPITMTGSGTVMEGQPASYTFPSGWLEGTADFKITISSFPAIKFTNSLRYLIRYPHGCIEQTTSKLFPLIYFDNLAKLAEPELFKTNSVDFYLEQGLAKLESMQQPSGAFSYWPGGDDINTWGSIYASHFLVEARKAGYQISDRVYNSMLNALKFEAKRTLRDVKRTAVDSMYRIQKTAYACYVLALAGETELSTMLYLKNNKLHKMSDFSQFQLASAFALVGDMDTALSLLPRTVTIQEVKRETGGNFNSSVRSRAIMLATLAEVDPNHPSIPALVESLTKSASEYNRWYTTQENAFAFMALGKILKGQTSSQYSGAVIIDGQHFADFDSADQKFEDKEWAGKKVTLTIEGEGNCYYYWQASGLPVDVHIEEFDHDLKVRRRYLDRNGNSIDYNSTSETFILHQGDVLISEIEITAQTESLENVIITDMLPAGLEIENPRLQSRAGISWISDESYKPDYMDIRDDRLIIFGNFPRQKEQTFYYTLRAVTQGDFILPPVTGEAMYAPAKSSVASSGNISVE